MTRVAPYHSTDPSHAGEYHVLDDCPSGQLIRRQDRRPGTGGGQLCGFCAQIQSNPDAPGHH